MKITVDKQPQYTLVKVHEEKLNSLVAPELKAQFVVIHGEGIKNVIVDLTDTRYCDSSGLSAVLVGNRLCRDINGTFIVTGLQDAVQKLISISQLDQVLTITPTLSEGVDIVFMNEVERGISEEKDES